MHVGTLTVDIEIPGADSLKDKRSVVRHLLETIRQKLNVSAAEVDQNDQWRRATLGFAAVANDGAFIQEVLDKVVHAIDGELRCEVTNIERDVY